ncbi:MAG: C2H2-type zinc finger protein [Thermofilaceae archaeon]
MESVKCPFCGSEVEVRSRRVFCEHCCRTFYVCTTCGEFFASRQALASHLRRHRERPDPRELLEEKLTELELRLEELEARLEELEERLEGGAEEYEEGEEE